MDLLNSDWLLAMLDKSSDATRQRLLNLFDILDDWLRTSQMREHLDQGNTLPDAAEPALLQYLAQQSRALRAPAPEALAHQLYFMAQSAVQQEIRTPGCKACVHARQAAQALLDAQLATTPRRHYGHYGLAAGLLIVAGLSGYLMMSLLQPAPTALHAKVEPAHESVTLPTVYTNPVRTAEMYASLERMRGGVCHYFEALMLPEGQQGVYLRNVVAGEVSSDASDRALAAQLMQRVPCDYAPMLMKNSTS